MKKQLVLLFFLLATTSSLMFVTSAYSSVDKLSVPEFTLKFEDDSYDVPTTYEIDQYTGETVVKRRGYHVEDKKIILTIKNQKFNSSYNPDYNKFYLYYSISSKGQFTEEWTHLYNLENKFELSSVLNFEYTTITIPARDYPYGAQVDFQVAACIGHYEDDWIPNDYISPGRYHWEPLGTYVENWKTDALSGWSETQTLTITAPESPTDQPEQKDQPDQTTLILAGALIMIPVAAGLGLLIRIGRKKS